MWWARLPRASCRAAHLSTPAAGWRKAFVDVVVGVASSRHVVVAARGQRAAVAWRRVRQYGGGGVLATHIQNQPAGLGARVLREQRDFGYRRDLLPRGASQLWRAAWRHRQSAQGGGNSAELPARPVLVISPSEAADTSGNRRTRTAWHCSQQVVMFGALLWRGSAAADVGPVEVVGENSLGIPVMPILLVTWRRGVVGTGAVAALAGARLRRPQPAF